MNKEYSDKGSPYAEYHIANNQVISQKMFGLHGLVTPGKEDTLNTNGGLMYYQYDGAGSVTELTNRQGDEIEHYRYDAFGNIFIRDRIMTIWQVLSRWMQDGMPRT